MRVLWPHNFDPAVPNSQVFMNIARAGLSALGIDVKCEYLGNLRSVSNIVRMRRHLLGLAADYDVVHAQYGSACALVAAAIHDKPKVLSIRGNDWNLYNESLGFLYLHTRLARTMTRWSLGSYDCLLTVSRRVAADVGRFAPNSMIVAMPSPIDLNRFVPVDKMKARAMLGFPDCSEKWILFNALNLDDPVKRFSLAQKVFDLAQAKLGNLRLRVATKMPHSDLPLFAGSCDLILCTSETEGWPNCVKEALACNVPFVATDVSDLADIAAQESCCRVCPPDPAVLADNICEVLTGNFQPDLRRHVADMALDGASGRLLKLYESLLSNRAGRRRDACNAGDVL